MKRWEYNGSAYGARRAYTTDRLGSLVRKDTTNYSYFPYGEPNTGAGTDYATYRRDATGLDYAVNRYYGNQWGRFMSPDPYQASGGPKDPGSWNRYSYVQGDPVNYADPAGLNRQAICYDQYEIDPIEGGLSRVATICDAGSGSSGPLTAPDPGTRNVSLAAHLALNMRLHAQTAEALRNLSPECTKAITEHGIDLNHVAEVAASTEYYDGSSSEGNFLVREISGWVEPSDKDQNLRTYLGSGRAGTLPDVSGNASNDVVVGTRFRTETIKGVSLEATQNLTLIHEALHTGTGNRDSALAYELGLGKMDQPAASASISLWLFNNCHPVN